MLPNHILILILILILLPLKLANNPSPISRLAVLLSLHTLLARNTASLLHSR
jgi:hypothetical protein